MLALDLASGTQVRFALESAICPETETTLRKITDRLEVTGKVVFLSDAGERRDHFAVVEVDGIMSPLVVPVAQLHTLPHLNLAQASVLKIMDI